MSESILTILAGLITLLVYWWKKKTERERLSQEEIKRGEAAEAAAKETAQKNESQINQSIEAQDSARDKADF